MSPTARIWLAVAALAAGTATGPTLGWVPGAGLTIAGLMLSCLRRARTFALIGTVIAVFGLGISTSALRAGEGASLGQIARGVPRCSIVASVLEDIGAMGTLVALQAADCGEGSATTGAVLIRASPGPPGTLFEGEGLLVPLANEGFDRVIRRAGAQAKFHLDDARRLRGPSGLHGIANALRSSLVAATAGLRPDEAGLLRGLATGDTDELGPQALEDMRRAGLSHLVAVSGSNVAIVVGAVLFALRNRAMRLRYSASAAALALFVIVVGPDPSVLRAVAMGALVLVAAVLGYRTRPLNLLGLAVIGVLGLRPGMVWSVGLHLSVAATAGLILWMGPIARRLYVLPRALAMVLAATLGAQLAVLPILAFTFGEVSLVAPLANLVAAPAVPPATILTLLAAVVGLVSPALAALMGSAAAPFARWILGTGATTGGWALAVVSVGDGSAVLASAIALSAAAAALRPEPIASKT